MASGAKPWLIQAFFYWLHETAEYCYFGVDLGNRLDHNSLSRFADGTRYSSSDLLYFTFLLHFTWIIYSKSNSISPFSLLDKIFLSPIPLLSSLRTKLCKSNFEFLKFFLDISKLCLSQIPIASHRKYSKTIPNCVLVKFQSHLIENIPRHFRITSLSIFSLTYLFRTLAIGV